MSIEVPPGQAIRLMATTTISRIEVPYTMKVKTSLNTTEVVKGTWKGATIGELQKNQTRVSCDEL